MEPVNIQALTWAQTKIGAKYSQAGRWGSNTFDCSSFVYRAYGAAGIKLVHKETGAAVCTSDTEVYAKDFALLWPGSDADIGQLTPCSAGLLPSLHLQPGDLIFYNHTQTTRRNNITHVAMAVGDGRIIHARNSAKGVCYDPVSYMATGVCAVTRYEGEEAAGMWKKENGKWYYVLGGKNLTGWQKLKWSGGTNWFYFASGGHMLTGWQKLNWDGKTD